MTFDLIVIGTGPGGYVCAIRAAQLGLKIARGREERHLRRHLPQRRLHSLEGAAARLRALRGGRPQLRADGHQGRQAELDLPALLKRKDAERRGQREGHRVPVQEEQDRGVPRRRRASSRPGQVEVKAADGKTQTLETKNIVIATGSDVAPAQRHRHRREAHRVVDRRARTRRRCRRSSLVIGAGVIGLELGSVWRRLGAQVTVVEFLDHILPGIDGEVAQAIPAHAAEAGHRVQAVVEGDRRSTRRAKTLKVERRAGGRRRRRETLEADVVLVAIGRAPYTEGLGLEAVGVKPDNRGRIVVDAHLRTNVAGIYAIGDVIAGPMLAHKAEDEGVAVAEIIAGQAGHVNYDVDPERRLHLAGDRLGRQDRGGAEGGGHRLQGRQVSVHRQRPRARQPARPTASSRSWPTPRPIACSASTSSAPTPASMIAEAAVAMEFGASSEDIARTCHAHPTLTRGGEGSGAGREQTRDQFLIALFVELQRPIGRLRTPRLAECGLFSAVSVKRRRSECNRPPG